MVDISDKNKTLLIIAGVLVVAGFFLSGRKLI
jgi:hypothetical protein